MSTRTTRRHRDKLWQMVQPFALVVFAKVFEVLAKWLASLLGVSG